MNYTTHYNLPQWELSDRIMMEDFNQAMASIDQGMAAAYTPDNMPYAAGTYTGDGKAMAEGGQLIPTGFRPRFVIITRGWLYANNMPSSFIAAGESCLEGTENFITLQDTGFVVAAQDSGHMQPNTADLVYSYIAFR